MKSEIFKSLNKFKSHEYKNVLFKLTQQRRLLLRVGSLNVECHESTISLPLKFTMASKQVVSVKLVWFNRMREMLKDLLKKYKSEIESYSINFGKLHLKRSF